MAAGFIRVKSWVSNWNFDTFDEWRKLRPQLATSRTKVADDFRRLWLWMAKRWYRGKVKWQWGLLQGAFSCCVLSILFSRVVVIVLIAWVCFMLRRFPGQCIQHRADNVQVLRGPLCFLPTCTRCTGGKGSTGVPHWPWPEFAQLMASEMAETQPRCWLFILFRTSSSSPSKVCAENMLHLVLSRVRKRDHPFISQYVLPFIDLVWKVVAHSFPAQARVFLQSHTEYLAIRVHLTFPCQSPWPISMETLKTTMDADSR